MERMRELVQQSTSGSTELAASSDQMSKMSRGLLEFMDRFTLEDSSGSRPTQRAHERPNEGSQRGAARRAAVGSQS
jgi:hypothetical protein